MRIISILTLVAAMGASHAAAQSVTLPVRLDPSVTGAQSGRILIFAHRIQPDEKPSDSVDVDIFRLNEAAVAARDVAGLQPGAVATIDGETDTFLSAFSALPPGNYRFQAVLDVNHDYTYTGRGGGDIVSPVVEAALPGAVPVLTLKDVLPEQTADSIASTFPPALAAKYHAAQASVRQIDFVSPALSAFWGRPIHIRGQVALPPGYKGGGPKFPVAYSTSGYGGTLLWTQFSATHMVQMMASGEAPPMIWVYLDQSSPTGTHEFADSVNNGPWGQALITELIPWIDRNYATDGVPSSRFLTGHSSGGWATLWLQVRYPKMFGGSWPTSPDPSDFHDFFNADLYAPDANAYRDANGNAYPMLRDHGKVVAAFEQLAKMETVLGPYGGQDASFEWVFSPRGPDGRPVPMFDRTTGKVNPDVVAYWHDHYDIANIVARDWKRLKPDLDGKIHLYVGADDSFYLDGPAHRLQATFLRLGAHEDFTFVPGKTHFDLMAAGNDPDGLLKTIAWAMYAKARPGAAQAIRPRP